MDSELEKKTAISHTNCALNVGLAVLVKCVIFWTAAASAETVCSLKLQFANERPSADKSDYKIGIKLDHSLVYYAFDDPQMLSSAKAVWSQGLKQGDTTMRTINLRFNADCLIPRQFEFYVCWRRSGRAGRPHCRFITPTSNHEQMSWAFKIELSSADKSSAPHLRVLNLSSDFSR